MAAAAGTVGIFIFHQYSVKFNFMIPIIEIEAELIHILCFDLKDGLILVCTAKGMVRLTLDGVRKAR